MSIIKAFYQEHQPEKLTLEPSYISGLNFGQCPKIRLEYQGFESQSFISHLGKPQSVQSLDDAHAYLMLREPKKAYWISQKELDFDEENKEKDNEQDFDDLFANAGRVDHQRT